MTTRIGINGFGRIGRLVVRALRDHPSLQLVHINEVKGGPLTAAHLLEFDSVHGRYSGSVQLDGDTLVIDSNRVSFSDHDSPAAIDWNKYGVDVVLECSGKFKTAETIQPHFDRGAQKVVVACPVKSPGILNIVMGCNDHLYDPATHHLVTAASCTTNSLAPVVKVLHESVGIERGSITTIHDVTNTQTIVGDRTSIIDIAHTQLVMASWRKFNRSFKIGISNRRNGRITRK